MTVDGGSATADASYPRVALTYLDASYEFDPEERPQACVNTVLGWELPARIKGYVTVASEYTTHGYRALTNVPRANILLRKVL